MTKKYLQIIKKPILKVISFFRAISKTTYQGLGTPNSPGNTASMYQVRIPYNTESMSNMPMAPAKEYLSPVPTKSKRGCVKYSHAF